MTQSSSDEAGAQVRFPPPLIFLICILSGMVFRYAVTPAPVPLDSTIGAVAGVLVLAIGIGFIATARTHFVRTGQNPIPWKPTPELIVNGPYRYTRNPMYLGATLFEVGLGVALNNLWISLFAALALAAVHVVAVLPEERYLSSKFGESYTRYLAQVRRYL